MRKSVAAAPPSSRATTEPTRREERSCSCWARATLTPARPRRQRGEQVFFLTGTDEHGEPVADAAHAKGVSPQQLADENAERFKALLPLIDASNDFFIRTTDAQHMSSVQAVLSQVREAG